MIRYALFLRSRCAFECDDRSRPLSVIRVLRPISSKADLQVSPNRRKPSAAAHSLVKPSLLHASEPTPLWTKKSPLGSYFFLISASRG
jgi:hypothetical protein